ncbi:hypothetical protein COMNV_01412 [Commensalibacter sp. Nvir]|nr:hypothetical protein COMNV_01412 [Commensalibacter sp. Nvir]
MFAMSKFDQLIDSRGFYKAVEGYVIDCVASNNNEFFSVATADGELWVIDCKQFASAKSWQNYRPHNGGILCLTQGFDNNSFLTAGDDNQIAFTKLGDKSSFVLKTMGWVEHMHTWLDSNSNSYNVALSVGKQIVVYRNSFKTLFLTLEHSSTVNDFCLNKQKNALAMAHYDGATLWKLETKNSKKSKEFSWSGSHLQILVHPKNEVIVTSMQNYDLHGWRISDGHNMRMSGYDTKVKSLSFSQDGKWLATSGTESVVLWPFFDGGPMGKVPNELPGIPNHQCSFVQFHPVINTLLVAGFTDGSILLFSINDEKILPIVMGREKRIGSISCIKFNSLGNMLCFGTEEGYAGIVNMSK